MIDILVNMNKTDYILVTQVLDLNSSFYKTNKKKKNNLHHTIKLLDRTHPYF